ncbi:hypothetical protein F0T03_06515 [Yersinia canariae]|uniref:Uncharacterized protein n=1 Tax=Yersinia canariae TaxID=2607663 RepID=A0A857EZB0_9GAMM|nr:hypothetical protein [Yersinia canariae]QHB31849.1 hypothetical protein F0T03_06515 [Yersinia canariae]
MKGYKYQGDTIGLTIGKMRVLMCLEGEEQAVREAAVKFDKIFSPAGYEESQKPGELTVFYVPFVKYEAEFIKMAQEIDGKH